MECGTFALQGTYKAPTIDRIICYMLQEVHACRFHEVEEMNLFKLKSKPR